MSSTIEYPAAKGRPGAAARPVTAAEINAEQDWTSHYAAAREDLQTTTRPFAMMTPTGFLRDEGALGTAHFMGRAISRPALPAQASVAHAADAARDALPRIRRGQRRPNVSTRDIRGSGRGG